MCAAPVIFLVGPTAVGKTALACALLSRFRFEIVSADSALVYRHMDIGTAKPDAQTLAHAPHRLIDLIDPDQAYSAADFRRDALLAIADIHARGKIPLLVGGSMMYVKALIDGLSTLPPADAATRAQIEREAALHGWPAMYAELARVDAISAARLAPRDTQRIQRALEVFRLSGTPLSALQVRDQAASSWPYKSLLLGLMPIDRVLLHARITQRFESMLTLGMVAELRALRQRFSLMPSMPAMRCVGYRQAWQFIDGAIDQRALHDTGIAATRQLAKRQMTWMRSMPALQRIDPFQPEVERVLATAIETFLMQCAIPATAPSA